MPIEKITVDDLRDMEHQEGLVLQGCGGEAQEWLDGINDLLTQDGILQNGNRFETVKVFQHDGLTNLLFPFEDIQVDMGKLAMWRLQTHGAFGGTWLSDYVPNRLGGFRSARQEPPPPSLPSAGAGRQHLPSDGYCRQSSSAEWHGGRSKGNADPHHGRSVPQLRGSPGNHQRICGNGAVSAPRKSNEKEGEA